MDEALYRNWFQWAQERLGPDVEAADRAACAAVAAVNAGLGFKEAERAARSAANARAQTVSDHDSGYSVRLERMHERLAPVHTLDREAATSNHEGRLHPPTQQVIVVRRLFFFWILCSALVIVGIAIILDAWGNPTGTLLGVVFLLLAILPAYLSRAHLADLRTNAVDSITGDVRKHVVEGTEDNSYYLTVMGRRFQVRDKVFKSVDEGETITIFFSRHGGTFLNLEMYAKT